jgi:DNA-binding CsgD family transcriptional regulator/PAS domain-containing protein
MQGLETETFSSVVSSIYDCALNPEGWSEALTRISQLMDAAYATISLADTSQYNAVMAAHSPWDPQMLQLLNDEYGVEGVPGLRQVVFGDLDAPQSTMNQMSEDEFQRSRFYQNWVRPQNLRDGCVTKFAQTGTRLGIVGVITRASRDIITADERYFMQLVSPHLRRAALIGDLLDQARVTTHLYKQTLTSLATPIILTDRTGKLLFANPRADELLVQGKGIRITKGVLTSATPMGSAALADAIIRASEDDISLGSRGIGIQISDNPAEPMIAYVLPLTKGTLRGTYENAAVAIFISSGSSAVLPPDSALITLYDLTPAEARVLLAIGGGETISQTAVSNGLSENTVKTHLGRVFAKTGTSRQVDLARLVAMASPPVV